METSFVELRKKEAINVLDGKRLGRVCDVVFSFPEGRVRGIVVPGGRFFHFGKGDLFIELKQIKKIGVDVILVEIDCASPPDKKKECPPPAGNCPPPQKCPPPCPPPNCPPRGGYDRRDYGDYE